MEDRVRKTTYVVVVFALTQLFALRLLLRSLRFRFGDSCDFRPILPFSFGLLK